MLDENSIDPDELKFAINRASELLAIGTNGLNTAKKMFKEKIPLKLIDRALWHKNFVASSSYVGEIPSIRISDAPFKDEIKKGYAALNLSILPLYFYE